MIYTTIASWSQIIHKALQAEGIDPAPVFKDAGIDASLISKQGHRFELTNMTRLWELAAQASTNDCFGLYAGKHWHPTSFHALGIAWLSSPTLFDAFERLVRYSALISTVVEAELVDKGDTHVFRYSLKTSADAVHDQVRIAAISSLVVMIRQMIGDHFTPVSVDLDLPKPACDKEIREFLRCDIQYRQDKPGMVIATEILHSPLMSSNMELLQSSEIMIADYLKKIGKNDILATVRVEMMRQLPSGNLTDDSVAQAMHMSTRTLQRRLADFNYTYRQLLEEVRTELAEKYLSDPNYSITEIAFLLGFAETSSFSKSYKKWTGQSPSESKSGR